MLIKNLLRIVKSYKFSLITIVFYEIIYLLKGFKGNKFHFSENNKMSDDIPCPYYFLTKIKKELQKEAFNIFIDLGCGSGRIIDFFSKNFSDKKFIGIEYFNDQYEYCKKIFKEKENIYIFQDDFTKSDFFKYNSDCYLFNNPFRNEKEFVKFMDLNKKFFFKKKIIFIFANYNKKTIYNLKYLKTIKNFYISENKGYSICYLNNDLK